MCEGMQVCMEVRGQPVRLSSHLLPHRSWGLNEGHLYPQNHTASPYFVLRQSLAGWLRIHHAVWSDLKLKAVLLPHALEC